MIRIEIKDDVRNLNEIAEGLAQETDDVLTAVGTELLGFIADDFEKKSEGKAGDDGVTWAPLDEKTIKRKNKRNRSGAAPSKTMIGIDTGIMRDSITPGFKAGDGKGDNVFDVERGEVTVGYGRTYARYFDERRPMIPEELPKPWEEACEEIVFDWVEDLWNKKLKGS